MDLSLYHDTFNLFCDLITQPNASVLDVACGPGNITHYLLQQRPDFKILGVDLALNMLALARTNNPTAGFELMDGRDIGQLSRQFDGIMCGFGLPYFSKEEAVQFIKDAASLLGSGGVIYLSTMEDDYEKSGIETTPAGNQLFIHYHQADYLVAALESNGFEMIGTSRKTYPGKPGQMTTDLILIASKN